MQAGRELDLIVHQKVMGVPECGYLTLMIGDRYIEGIPHYMTDMVAAWKVVEKMQDGGFAFELKSHPKIGVCASFIKNQSYKSSEETIPAAICLAALKAKNVRVTDELDRLQKNKHKSQTGPRDSGKTNDLPQMRFLSRSDVIAMTGLSRSTIQRLERVGLFPSRKQLTLRKVAWVESEIIEWMKSRENPATNSQY